MNTNKLYHKDAVTKCTTLHGAIIIARVAHRATETETKKKEIIMTKHRATD